MSKASEKTIRLSISGMHCGNCVVNVEKKFQETNGVLSVVVNLASNSAVVVYDEKIISEKNILHVLDNTQFTAQKLIDTFDTFSEQTKNKHKLNLKKDLIKLLISVFLTAIVLVLHYISDSNIFISLAMLVLTIPVQFYCGLNFITGGWKSIVNKNLNMDLLVSVGTLVAFVYSCYSLIFGGHVMFETCCMLISFISFGEYIENRAKNQTNKAVEELVDLMPKTITVLKNVKTQKEILEKFKNDEKFSLEEIPANQIKVGSYIFIEKGKNVPADAKIIAGKLSVDESMLTGESELCKKGLKDEITGGTLVVEGQAIAKVLHLNNDSVLAKIVRAVMDAQSSKAPVARIADKVASVFVPVVLGLSLITLVLWIALGHGLVVQNIKSGIMCAVSVLTISCPCALVLATPITLTVGMGRAAQMGVIIRDGAVLENMCKLKNIVFDKTGTLTMSNLDKNKKAAKTLRPDAAETIKQLNEIMNINTYMLSGDVEKEALRIANEIGIPKENVVFGANPISKKEYLVNLMKKANSNKKTAGKFGYVGDGINDAPAMATADIGITLESATDIALESGSVVLMHNKLSDLLTAIRLSKASMRKIKQNLFWSLFYNVLFIPLAAFGCMIPMWCGAVHAISSLIVVFNALMLKKFR